MAINLADFEPFVDAMVAAIEQGTLKYGIEPEAATLIVNS